MVTQSRCDLFVLSITRFDLYVVLFQTLSLLIYNLLCKTFALSFMIRSP